MIPGDLSDDVQATTSTQHARKKARHWIRKSKLNKNSSVVDGLGMDVRSQQKSELMNESIIKGAKVRECVKGRSVKVEVLGYSAGA